MGRNSGGTRERGGGASKALGPVQQARVKGFKQATINNIEVKQNGFIKNAKDYAKARAENRVDLADSIKGLMSSKISAANSYDKQKDDKIIKDYEAGVTKAYIKDGDYGWNVYRQKHGMVYKLAVERKAYASVLSEVKKIIK